MRKALKILAALFVLGLVLLAAGEVFVRVFVPDTVFSLPFDRTLSLYQAEDARAHPHSTGATNLLKIAVIGDSITFGAGNHRYDRFPSRLEWLMNLNEGVPPAEVEVFAKPTALYQQFKLLDKALEYQPSIILLIVHLNDTEDWSNAQEMVNLRNRAGADSPPRRIEPLVLRSRLAHLAWLKWDRRRMDRAFRDYYEYLYRPDYSGLQKFREAAREFRGICESNRVQLVGVLFPLLNQDLRPGRYPYDRQHEIARGAFADAGIPMVDLLDAFRGRPSSRVQNIPLLDAHPSEIGHRIAADAIFEFLVDRQFVSDAYRPHDTSDPKLVVNWVKKIKGMHIFGDVLRENSALADR